MGIFLRRTKGSITVMAILILVPTIFFTGFLTDLARIKLYGNQALMTADNYGEAVISNYDNLLKELYGLFAVSQSEEGEKALKEIQKYMSSSFDPNQNRISGKYFQAAQAKWGSGGYVGFMPYKDADVKVSYQAAAGANLGDEKVLSTQVGDFMRFRIAQQLLSDGEMMLKALDAVQNMKGEAEVIEAKNAVDEQAGKVLEQTKAYYEILKKINAYPGFIAKINSQYEDTQKTYKEISESSSYKTYQDYVTHETEIAAARERKNNLGEGESLSEQETELVQMGDAYDADLEARREKLAGKFDVANGKYADQGISDPVDFNNYETLVTELNNQALVVKSAIKTLQTAKSELEEKLDENTVNADLKKGIKDDLRDLEMLFGDAGNYSADNYVKLASEIKEKNVDSRNVNSEYLAYHIGTYMTLEDIRDDYLNFAETIRAYDEPLDEGIYYKFWTNGHYRILYESLEKCFLGKGEAEAYKQKKENADKERSAKETALSNDEATQARNIPDTFELGSGGSGGFELAKVIKEASSYFQLNKAQEMGNKLLLKAYMINYDFGMFSSRMTNQKQGEEAAVSLTGVKMGPDVNYLYGAELEYILGGCNLSKDNLNVARNKILAFRSVINMTATYTIKEIDLPIKAVKTACSAFNPLLGFAVAAALRGAVVAYETYRDWEELKKGEPVILTKNLLGDLLAYDDIMALLDKHDPKGTSSNGLKLDYEQYLMVMIIFLTTTEEAARRTGNLITLNMNAVRQGVGSDQTKSLEKLEWRLSNAVTVVDATCSVRLGFVVVPDGFARQMTLDGYDAFKNFENNAYQFTVTRGY